MPSAALSLRSVLLSGCFALLPAGIACSSKSAAQVTGDASITGPSIGAVRSASLIASGSITDAGPVGTPTTYVQFFSDAPGTACASLDAGTIVLAGSLSIAGDPSTLNGRTLVFGQTPDVFLTLIAAAGSEDASTGDSDGGEPGNTAGELYAVSGTALLDETSGTLKGTIDAQMVQGSDPGGPTVHVTGTFSAPACGD